VFEDAKHITDMMRAEKTETGELRYKARRRFSQELATRTALAAMGFKRADAVSALGAVRDALTAKKTTYFQHEGVVTDKRTTADHRTRLHAANAIFDMVPGVKAPQEHQKPSGEISLEIITLAPDGTRTAVRVQAP
jgi:hypothetical protein